MTCIVGCVVDNEVYIGGDSAGVRGLDIRTRCDEKVFKNKDMIYGFTSSFRMGQLLRYKFNIPDKPEGMDDFEYLCTIFIDELIKCLVDNKYARVSDNITTGGLFLLGYNGNIYSVESDFQVTKDTNNYMACGCGEDYALGSLYATNEISGVKKIESALKAATYFSAGVCEPYNIVKL